MKNIEKIKKLKEIIYTNNKIIFLGGAGVSTESGIHDFRSLNSNIYYSGYNYSPEIILSHDFFMKKTEEFYKFYKEKILYDNIKPNMIHFKLAKLEKIGRLKTIITQNIDNLHYIAGSKNIIELHGNINNNYCIKCNMKYDVNYIKSSNKIPKCKKCNNIIKPGIILYNEKLDNSVINRSINAIRYSDVMIVGGTSLVVYPAASLINYFKGSYLIIINKDKTQKDILANFVINDSLSNVFSYI